MRFDGWILGVGTGSGIRVVVGRWAHSPFGAFADVMVQRPDGHRLLLAPTAGIAAFVAGTYVFDEVVVTPVTATPDWAVAAGPLALRAAVGSRTGLGRLLHLVPPALATAPAWVTLLDGPARVAGMRTRGSAGSGRTEFYGVTDLHRVTAVTATWASEPLGGLAPVRPAVTFGFASVPADPSVARVVTTVR
jgi:hypothetical protein